MSQVKSIYFAVQLADNRVQGETGCSLRSWSTWGPYRHGPCHRGPCGRGPYQRGESDPCSSAAVARKQIMLVVVAV